MSQHYFPSSTKHNSIPNFNGLLDHRHILGQILIIYSELYQTSTSRSKYSSFSSYNKCFNPPTSWSRIIAFQSNPEHCGPSRLAFYTGSSTDMFQSLRYLGQLLSAVSLSNTLPPIWSSPNRLFIAYDLRHWCVVQSNFRSQRPLALVPTLERVLIIPSELCDQDISTSESPSLSYKKYFNLCIRRSFHCCTLIQYVLNIIDHQDLPYISIQVSSANLDQRA